MERNFSIYEIKNINYKTCLKRESNYVDGPNYREWITGSTMTMHLSLIDECENLEEASFNGYAPLKVGDKIKALFNGEDKKGIKNISKLEGLSKEGKILFIASID